MSGNTHSGTLELTYDIQFQPEWDFRGQNTQYGTHGIHTYVGAMIPQLARILIDRYAPTRGTVLDPFCGGGAVLVEAVQAGHEAIGRDVNELAILISKAKTTRVDEPQVREIANSIVAGIENSPQIPLLDSNLRYWFKAEHLAQIHTLYKSIAAHIPLDSPLAPLFLAVFSAAVRDVSLTYRNEIRLRRMTPNEIDNFNVDPIERFQKRIEYAACVAATLPQNIDPDIITGDVQALSLRDNDCSAIVCSPPYGDERNGISYTQFSKNMLRWLGYSQEQIRESKERTLGWGKAERIPPRSQTLDTALDAISEFPDSVRGAIAFYADYQAALMEMVRVTSGPVVIVIGQRVLRDTIIDNGKVTAELMQNIGATLTEAFYRKLPSKRLPKMRKFGAAIDSEAVLVFQK